MSDIQGIFHQVSVKPEHRNFLRFLWWDNSNFDTQPNEYRMTVHLLGATSFLGCANYAQRRQLVTMENNMERKLASSLRGIRTSTMD